LLRIAESQADRDDFGGSLMFPAVVILVESKTLNVEDRTTEGGVFLREVTAFRFGPL
jgi:hypothetical protein